MLRIPLAYADLLIILFFMNLSCDPSERDNGNRVRDDTQKEIPFSEVLDESNILIFF